MTAVRAPERSRRAGRAAAAATSLRARQSPQLPAPASRPQLQVAQTSSRRAVGRLAVVLGIVALIAAVMVVLVFQTFLVQSQDRLDDLQRQITEQEVLARRQALELAELHSPTRIAEAATERLGMVAPSEVVYLRHDPSDDAALTVPDPVPATDGPDTGAGE
jgi:cell division protein FtsL